MSATNRTAMSFYSEHCSYLPAMLGWFFFSACLSIYNTKVFGDTHYAFPYPLFLTSIHFMIQWTVSVIITDCFPQTFGREVVVSLSWKDFLYISIPCGLVTCLDIGLSNLALVRITLTFYTMVKASTPIFVLICAFLFGLEKVSWRLILVVIIISLGEFLTVCGESVDFSMVGFLLVLGASFFSGLRWTLVQLLLNKLVPHLPTAFSVMRVLSPSMVFFMVMLSVFIEQPQRNLFDQIAAADDPWYSTLKELILSDEMWITMGLGVGGGFLAVCMVFCEFWLIMRASAVVLMMGGVLKEMFTIFLGVSFFGDSLNLINMLGCTTVFSGVLLYKAMHYLQNKEMKLKYEEELIAADIEEEGFTIDRMETEGFKRMKRDNFGNRGTILEENDEDE
eukprot:CAMPEP_0194386856 /NCGR_PEP_ID=MMETSP0174-20130528/88785_1 /TAXON_ID=216777 /ORGANISM="Proboscia alata, Strain PI-D3" /LENGTH=392 /DNA_ID=CAMNT_0039176449 /DNA_START=407 /DNA_END=1582 /DNA_ORIENTATION=-